MILNIFSRIDTFHQIYTLNSGKIDMFGRYQPEVEDLERREREEEGGGGGGRW